MGTGPVSPLLATGHRRPIAPGGSSLTRGCSRHRARRGWAPSAPPDGDATSSSPPSRGRSRGLRSLRWVQCKGRAMSGRRLSRRAADHDAAPTAVPSARRAESGKSTLSGGAATAEAFLGRTRHRSEWSGKARGQGRYDRPDPGDRSSGEEQSCDDDQRRHHFVGLTGPQPGPVADLPRIDRDHQRRRRQRVLQQAHDTLPSTAGTTSGRSRRSEVAGLSAARGRPSLARTAISGPPVDHSSDHLFRKSTRSPSRTAGPWPYGVRRSRWGSGPSRRPPAETITVVSDAVVYRPMTFRQTSPESTR